MLFAAAEAGEVVDLDRPVGETVGKILEMLLRQQRGRHQHGDLFAPVDGEERGPHSDLGLAEAHIATDHSIHRSGGFHIGQYGIDGLLLIRSLFEFE